MLTSSQPLTLQMAELSQEDGELQLSVKWQKPAVASNLEVSIYQI